MGCVEDRCSKCATTWTPTQRGGNYPAREAGGLKTGAHHELAASDERRFGDSTYGGALREAFINLRSVSLAAPDDAGLSPPTFEVPAILL